MIDFYIEARQLHGCKTTYWVSNAKFEKHSVYLDNTLNEIVIERTLENCSPNNITQIPIEQLVAFFKTNNYMQAMPIGKQFIESLKPYNYFDRDEIKNEISIPSIDEENIMLELRQKSIRKVLFSIKDFSTLIDCVNALFIASKRIKQMYPEPKSGIITYVARTNL